MFKQKSAKGAALTRTMCCTLYPLCAYLLVKKPVVGGKHVQHGFVDETCLVLLCSTAQLKKNHHKTPIKLLTTQREKAPYLNQIERKFVELLKAKLSFDKKMCLSKGRGHAGPMVHL